MSSYRHVYYHLVFHTKSSNPTISNQHCESLYAFIWGIVKNKNSKLLQINGTEDHLHLLLNIHPSHSVADMVKDIKVFSSVWIKKSNFFPEFTGWAEGYGCFTISYREKDKLIGYIKKQKEHHKTQSFEEEFRSILSDHQIEIDERYFLK